MTLPHPPHADVIPLRSPRPGDHALTSVQGALALDLTPRMTPPRPRLHGARSVGVTGVDLVAVEMPARRQLDAFIARYLQAVVEIAAGDRPVAQVLRHTAPQVYDDLGARARTVGSLGAPAAPGQGRGPNPARPVVVGVRTALIRSDAVEASAHVRYGRRSRAVAARLEIVRDRWQCVALEWG